MSKIYVTTMYRYGDKERHSYVLGAFDHASDALTAGEDESCHRGRKYYFEVIEIEINAIKKPRRVILSVDESKNTDLFIKILNSVKR